MQTRSATKAMSTSPLPPTAQQQVLGIDKNLLQEVFSFLGADVAECHAALLVSHFWNDALERTNPWARLLQRDFPSMSDPSFFLSHDHHHSLFQRTAKDLLGLRLVGANQEASQKRDLRRLEEQFRDKSVTLLIRHPTHGVIAESKIPIAQGEGVSSCGGYFVDEGEKSLRLHEGLFKIPMSEFEHCVVEWQMPGELELFKVDILEVKAYDAFKAEGYLVFISWMLNAAYPKGVHTGINFINNYFHGENDFSLSFSTQCVYFSLCCDDLGPDVKDLARKVLPDEIIDLHTFSINVPSCSSFEASPLEYLKVMDSWMVAARQSQDDGSETARLRSRFEKVYLLVEVGVKRGLGVERSVHESEEEDGGEDGGGDEDKEEDESEGKDATYPAVDIVSYALVSLVDEAALLDLFNTQTTRLQFVKGKDGTGRLPLVGDRVVVRVSVLDLGENCVVKLSEGIFFWPTPDADDPEVRWRITPCEIVGFDKKIDFCPTFEDEEAITSGEDGVRYAATVELAVYAALDEEDEEDEWREVVCDHSNPLALWKTLEICLTGGAV